MKNKITYKKREELFPTFLVCFRSKIYQLIKQWKSNQRRGEINKKSDLQNNSQNIIDFVQMMTPKS